MQALGFIAGNWEGTGTMIQGPGRSLTARGTERVEYKLQGSALLVEGRGIAKREGKDVVVHDALAVITWDSTAHKYSMRTWRANGETLAPDLEVGDRRLVWGFADPRAGRVRFTVVVDSTQHWNEIGEYSRDSGATWVKFLEMRLARVEPR
jgi:hypothetical protein